jgi:two-component system, NarL family, sensor histidine kinase UhpB
MKFRTAFPSNGVWAAAILIVTGLVTISIALWSVLGWHMALHWPSPAMPIAIVPLQYDTAWAFAIGGASLIAYAFRLALVGALMSALAFAIAALRLLTYFLPAVASIHPLLANPWLPSLGTTYPAMSVLTALIWIVLGVALLWLRPSTRRPWRSVLVALLASIALALALLQFFGAWTAGVATSDVLRLTGGERTDAGLFMFITCALLAHAILGSEQERTALRRSLPIIVWFAVFACTLVLWRTLTVEESQFVDRSTSLVAADAQGQIERDLNTRIDLIEALAARSTIDGLEESAWRRDASTLLGGVVAFEALSWSGADGVVRWVVPSSITQKMVGFDRRQDPARRRALEAATAQRKPTLSGFLDLNIGGNGVIVYAPAFAGEEFKGMVAATFGDRDWLRSLIDGRFPDHHIDLLQDGVIVRSVGPAAEKADAEWSQQLSLPMQNMHWTLRATPTQQYVQATASGLPNTALAIGLVLATLLGLSAYLFQTARARARELDRTNVRLVNDIARRYHVEQELRESESRIRLIINAVKDCAIYMLDNDGLIASWNPGAQALNGYTSGEIIGQHFSLLYPLDREQPVETELAVAARRGAYEEECWHLRKDGSRYCGDDIISAIRDEQGNLRGYSVVTRDATLRLELREQTEKARDFYFSLFSGLPNLIWRSDAEGACDYLNQAWLDYTGRERDAELGEGWLEGIHPEDQTQWRETYARSFEARKPFELEYRLRRSDGSYGWMICVGRPYHDMQGRFSGYLCSCYDNSARRTMESALKESEQRYEGMTSNVPGMVFQLRVDAKGALSFDYVSKGCQPLTGQSEQALRSDANAFFSLIPDSERPNVFATLDGSAAHLGTWTWSGQLRPLHESAEKWISIRARARRTETGDTLWDGLVFDDTQSRLAQLEIERSREELRSLSRHLQSVREEEKARIAREVHDELGSTLTALRMDLDWLAEKLPESMAAARQKRNAMVKLVEAAVAATRKIVTDLRPSILDDLGLAAALRWQAGEYAKHMAAQIHVETPDPDLSIGREASLALFRIFQETLTNVARHAKASEVTVTLGGTRSAYVLQIRDNGVGMDAMDVDKATSHGIRGMRERARQLGGMVTVTSERGDGTTLVVTIPKADAAAAA